MSEKEPVKVHEKDTKTKEKIQFSVRMPHPEVVEDFKTFVKATHDGRYYTYAGLELDYAIKKHLRDKKVEGYTDKDLENFYGSTSTLTKFNSADYFLIDYLKDNYYETNEVSFNELADVMRKECNLKDPRTHKSHVDNLEANEILLRSEEIRYSTYYYKKLPEIINEDSRMKKTIKNKNYSLLVKNNCVGESIHLTKFQKITGLDGERVKNAIEELEELGLLEYGQNSYWLVKEVRERSNQDSFNPVDDHLTALSKANSPEDSISTMRRGV